MSTPSKGNRKKSRARWAIPIVLIALTLGIGGAYVILGGESTEDQTIATLKVEPIDLTISLVEGGSLRAPKSFDVTSPIEGSATILSLAEEGSYVKKGELLVELDVSGKADDLTRQEIAVKNADASWTEARESLEIQSNINASNEREAELALEFARTDLRKFLGEALAMKIDELAAGDSGLGLKSSDRVLRKFLMSDLESKISPPGPADTPENPDDAKATQTPEYDVQLDYEGEWGQQRRSAETDIKIATEELTRAATRVNFTRELESQGYVTSDELIADQLAYTRRQIDLELSYSKQQVLLDYTGPSSLKRFLADVAKTKDELERATRKSTAELAKAQANLDAKEAVRRLEKEQYEDLQMQINSSKIYAPFDGLVVYATNSRGGRGRDERPLEVGSDVRERQLILSIPDASIMIADTKIHESALAKVRSGLGALITIDALEGKPLPGRVSKVGILPDSQSSWLNPDLKVYPAEVTIEAETQALRPGMSCSVEILVNRLEQVLAVPLYSVFRRGRVNYVLIKKALGEIEARVVEVGLNNDKMIHITSGLESGEVVLLGRPEGAPTPAGVEAAQDDSADFSQFPDALQPVPPGRLAPGGAGESRSEGPGGSDGAGAPGGMDPAEMKRRFENMSEEDKAKLRDRMRKNGDGAGGGRRGEGGSRGGRGGGSRGGERSSGEK